MIEEKYNLRAKTDLEQDPKERVLITMLNTLIIETKAAELLLYEEQEKGLNQQVNNTLEKAEKAESERQKAM